MIIDTEKGVTLEDLFSLMRLVMMAISDELDDYDDQAISDYNVSDDVVNALENKENYTPEDLLTLARAMGSEKQLLESDDLPPDFIDKANKFFELRNKFKLEEPKNVSTDNTAN